MVYYRDTIIPNRRAPHLDIGHLKFLKCSNPENILSQVSFITPNFANFNYILKKFYVRNINNN